MLSDIALSLIVAFAAGSIPFGWIIAKLWGIEDLRAVGSSNVGATNVVRTAGWLPGALTFGLDFAKGILPMLYLPEANIWVGLAAVLGHCYSPFLSFRGGKGVSTTLGALCAFNPWLGGASILIYIVALAITRVSALGSLFAMLGGLSGALIFTPPGGGKMAVALMVLVVLTRHKDNWNALLDKSKNGKSVVTTLVLASLLGAHPARLEASVVDFRGKSVETAALPRSIAALMPSLAEALVELGAGDRLVAAPEYTRLPPSLKKVQSLGPYNRISVESVYAAHPDLVFASIDGSDRTVVEKLESMGLRVVTLNSESLADIVRSIEIMSAALGKTGAPKVAELKRVLGSTRAPRHESTPRVFMQIGWDPLISVGPRTFIDEIIARSGGRNIFGDAPMRYPRPNAEEVIARNPEVIVICRLTDTGDEADRAKAFWLRFKNIPAVKSGRIHIMPVDWLTKPGFSLVKGMQELQRIL